MRLAVIVAVVLGLAILTMLILLKKNDLPAGGTMYEGTGETDLDLSSPENTLYLDLKDGRVVIQLRPDLAPIHVQRIKELVRQGFYDGLTWHRVIDGFMAQGGDPDGTGRGGTGVHLPGEFSREKFKRAAVGMARAASTNSADSQFFITLEDARHLDNQYTIWGFVTEGMEFVDNIKKGQPGRMDGAPDTIVRMRIAADEAKSPGAN